MKFIDEDAFWRKMFAKIKAFEDMITKCNPSINPKQVDIGNAIILKCGRSAKLSYLPQEFQKTSYIRSLDISHSRLPESVLKDLPHILPFLYALNLGSGHCYPSIPQNFRAWATLRSLALNNHAQDPEHLNEGMPRQLKYLVLRKFCFHQIPQFLSQMKQLKGLDLSHNYIPCFELAELPALVPQLEGLNVGYNELADLPLPKFGNFTRLLRLNLYGNALHDSAGFARMATAMPYLEVLILGQNGLTLIDLVRLSPMSNLKILHLEGLPGHNGYDRRKENKFSPDEQQLIQKAYFPQTNVIFSRS